MRFVHEKTLESRGLVQKKQLITSFTANQIHKPRFAVIINPLYEDQYVYCIYEAQFIKV